MELINWAWFLLIEKAEYAARYKDSEIVFSSKAFESAGIDTRHCDEERNRAIAEIKDFKEKALFNYVLS